MHLITEDYYIINLMLRIYDLGKSVSQESFRSKVVVVKLWLPNTET